MFIKNELKDSAFLIWHENCSNIRGPKRFAPTAHKVFLATAVAN